MANGDEPVFNIPAAIDLMVERIGEAGECPICKTGKWAVEGNQGSAANKPTEVAATYLQKNYNDVFQTIPPIPVITMTCRNCGYVRQHNLSWLQRELEASTKDG